MRALHLTALRSGASRAAAAAAALLCFTLAFPSIAGAANTGTGIGTETVASGSWGATLSATAFTFTSRTDQNATVTNSGSLALTGISYQVTIGKAAGERFALYVCTTAWVATRCGGGSGTQVGGTLSTGTTTTVTSTVVPPLAGHVYLQLEPSGPARTVTVTMATEITSSQLRATVTTNH